MSQHQVILLLGSNLGDQKKNLDTAINFLQDRCVLIKKTEYLISDPVEFASSNIFCNIVIVITTQLSPIQLLNYVKSIECEMGRTVDSMVSGEYSDRIIDIDIVKFGNLEFSSRRLKIPHQKHLFEREFSKILLQGIT